MTYKEKKRLVFFGLPFTFTTYTITDELITISSGLLRKTEDDAYMYKIVDVRLETSLGERIFGLGTIRCFGGDVTTPELVIRHIRNSKEIKDFIFSKSEEERLKRRTLNTMNIDGGSGVRDMVDGIGPQQS